MPARDTMNLLELLDLAIGDLQQIRSQVMWLQAQQDGRRRTGGAGPVSASGHSDPTGATVIGNVTDAPNALDDQQRSIHQVIAGKLHATERDLRWLVNKKLPGWVDRVTLTDEQPLPSDRGRHDDEGRFHPRRNDAGDIVGDAELDGGYSAYRGQTERDVPGGRPDIRAALAAQKRRLGRGEGYGNG